MEFKAGYSVAMVCLKFKLFLFINQSDNFRLWFIGWKFKDMLLTSLVNKELLFTVSKHL